jgi:hypothetical protein
MYVYILLLSSAPQPSLGLGLLKIRLNFLEVTQQFFYRVGLLAPRPTPILEDKTSVFISPDAGWLPILVAS